ncbi:hypothetical protein HELRODRAFT_167687 [Helobdella robusta]|uniref:Ion transport domain-containing protein n=1 Tax=Helobdella robusta TaxID=6412 RepID=T1EZN9_HELRO|nr:hypothetical protein HELRODRAFT_167687 [Helobdella robusta]ESO09869.1 hypothetical protein HELRODRAFT_167687 [Helobdella robusta]
MDNDSDAPASSSVPAEFLVLACADDVNSRERKDSYNELVGNEGSYQIQNTTDSINAQRWELNYYEASIYLNEGKDNDKFSVHPRNQLKLPIYKIVHSTWFHIVSLLVSIEILALVICESPTNLQLPVIAHAVLELLGLLLIFIEMFLKAKWLGFKAFISHRRTVFKLVVLVVMFVEAVVVIIRQSNHIRVTRALRPLFLLDIHYCRGYFQTFIDSFISLFILMTTSNFPDVMMPSYKSSKWSCIYFIVYISLQLFIFMNLLIKRCLIK